MSSSPAISVRELRTVSRVPEHNSGLRTAVISLFDRRTCEFSAVKPITFDIQRDALR